MPLKPWHRTGILLNMLLCPFASQGCGPFEGYASQNQQLTMTVSMLCLFVCVLACVVVWLVGCLFYCRLDHLIERCFECVIDDWAHWMVLVDVFCASLALAAWLRTSPLPFEANEGQTQTTNKQATKATYG